MPHSISLILAHIPLFCWSSILAAQHPPSVSPLTSIPPYSVPPSMPAPLTPCISLAAMGTVVGRLPSAGRPPRGESVCHSRLMPCSLTNLLLLVWNPSVLWRGPDREVMLSQLIATQVVWHGNLWSIHSIFQSVSQWRSRMLLWKMLWQVCEWRGGVSRG